MPNPNSKKPQTSTLRKIASAAKNILPNVAEYGTPVVGGLKLGRDIISRFALNRMAENLNPYEYSDAGTGKSALERAVDAVVLNKKEQNRSEQEQYIEHGYGMQPSPQFKERTDLLQMLAGKSQKYNTIEPSQYAPTKGAEDGSKYYKSKGIENAIIDQLGLKDKNIKWQKDIAKIITDAAIVNKKGNKQIGKGGAVAIIPGLGAATYGVGRDKKGIYISYSDTWDINPTKGVYSDEEASQSGMTLENLKNTAMGLTKKAGTYISQAKATPPKIYGRIYFDQNTGKPIQ